MTKRYLAILCLCVLLAPLAGAQQTGPDQRQTIALQGGWNLISPQVVPEDPSIEAVFAPLGDALAAVWFYDKPAEEWRSWFHPDLPEAVTNHLAPLGPILPGQAYWLHMQAAAELEIVGRPVTDHSLEMSMGWNLLGFPVGDVDLGEPINLVALLEASGAQYDVILQWENQQYQKYTPPDDELGSFAVLDPDKGYWVRISTGSVQLAPRLLSSVRPDQDNPPLGNFPSYEDVRIADVDPEADLTIDDDGAGSGPLDGTEQSHIAFFEGESRQTLSISNPGGGILVWSVEWEPWDRPDVDWLQVAPVRGVTTIETDLVTLYLDRTDLVKGTYRGALRLTSSAGERAFIVVAQVPGLSGEWAGMADIETVNQRDNPVPAVDLHLSFFEDETAPGMLRGLIDSSNCLLWPRDVPLVGYVTSNERNAFILNGAMILPPGDVNNPPYPVFPGREDINWQVDQTFDAMNPFPFPIQRSLSLVGTLVSASDQGGFRIEGRYTETVHGILRQPITMQGRFYLNRRDPRPFTQRRVLANQQSAVGDQPVVVLGESPDRLLPTGQTVERTVEVFSDIMIESARLELTVAGAPPSDITITLTSHEGVSAIVHDRAGLASLQDLVFPDQNRPVEGFERFRGRSARGVWRLAVHNHGGSDGARIRRWQLRIQGQPVFRLHGQVVVAGSDPPRGLPAEVYLHGHFLSLSARADGEGRFVFEGAPGGSVNLTAAYPGYAPLDASLPGVAGRAPRFENNPATDANERALSEAFRSLPGLPIPPAALPGYPGDLGTAANPITLALRPLTTPEGYRILAAPPVGPAPLTVQFTLIGPDGAALEDMALWDFGNGSATQADAGETVETTYPARGDYEVQVLFTDADGQMRELNRLVSVSALPGATDESRNIYQAFFTAGGTAPVSMVSGTSYPLLMVQHADCANFDIDRPPYTTADNRDFDADGLDGTMGGVDDNAGIFKGEDTDYFNPAAPGMPEDPCPQLRGPTGRFTPYPPPGSTDPVCQEPRYRMVCNVGPTLLPAAWSFAVAAPEMPGTQSPGPPDPSSADGVASARNFRMVTGPLAIRWRQGGEQ